MKKLKSSKRWISHDLAKLMDDLHKASQQARKEKRKGFNKK